MGQSFSTIPVPNPPIIRKGASGTFYDKGLEGASHHAVIPNANTIDKLREVWPRLSADEKKLFDVIARAYLAALMPDFRYRQTTATLDVRGLWELAPTLLPPGPGRSLSLPLLMRSACWQDMFRYAESLGSLDPAAVRWAIAEGFSENVIAGVLLFHERSVDEIALQAAIRPDARRPKKTETSPVAGTLRNISIARLSRYWATTPHTMRPPAFPAGSLV